MNQSEEIENMILQMLEDGITDKRFIYERIIKKTGAPREVVRRVSSDLVKKFKLRLDVLNIRLPPTRLRRPIDKLKADSVSI